MTEDIYKHSEERRKDPVLRERVTEVLNQQADAVREATPLLEEAFRILRKGNSNLSAYSQMALYRRIEDITARAVQEIHATGQYITDPRTDTYIGNIAASEVGYVLQRELDAQKDVTES